MAWHLQGTIFGQAMRLVSGNKFFRYPDEIDPSLWKKAIQNDTPDETPEQSGVVAADSEKGMDREAQSSSSQNQELQDDTEKVSKKDVLLVGWYGPHDPENPQNWPVSLRHTIIAQMCLLNFSVYIASSMYTPGEADFMKNFNVSEVVATLGLSLFTFGYGCGAMLWAPLSEMPKLGRSGIYFWTLLFFIIFQLAVGFAPNAPVFFVFRWVTGFLGSPCLSNGGGTVNDMYTPLMVPYLICIWSSAGVCGPVFGPIIGGYVAPAMGWRWTIWVFTWLNCLVLILLFFLSPETSAANILYNRAKRLRKATGDSRLKSQSELDAEHHTTKDTWILLSRAFILTFTEPIIFLMNLYAGLLYGLLFLWFESFPIVFGGIYGFSIGSQGLVFLGIFIFAVFSMFSYLLWIKVKLVRKITDGNFKPEMVLPPMFVGGFALPICMFWFGWSSRSSIHWIMPIIGSGFFSIGVVTLFNSLFTYLGLTFTAYAGSVFAGATLFRACFGASFPLFARALFNKLGVAPGNSLLGGLAILFVPVPYLFYFYGERIRGWSKRAS
ncbi:Caffeine resistance protein [Lachnellula willkommii]|uniref:Caffeine resistance protein n=1 Tax=Lachnellula willkommii TaxID=215461 RepID=A0A559MFB1_9HELO|nr:Caffeine resistance protein [Lachnellula willkommii]